LCGTSRFDCSGDVQIPLSDPKYYSSTPLYGAVFRNSSTETGELSMRLTLKKEVSIQLSEPTQGTQVVPLTAGQVKLWRFPKIPFATNHTLSVTCPVPFCFQLYHQSDWNFTRFEKCTPLRDSQIVIPFYDHLTILGSNTSFHIIFLQSSGMNSGLTDCQFTFLTNVAKVGEYYPARLSQFQSANPNYPHQFLETQQDPRYHYWNKGTLNWDVQNDLSKLKTNNFGIGRFMVVRSDLDARVSIASKFNNLTVGEWSKWVQITKNSLFLVKTVTDNDYLCFVYARQSSYEVHRYQFDNDDRTKFEHQVWNMTFNLQQRFVWSNTDGDSFIISQEDRAPYSISIYDISADNKLVSLVNLTDLKLSDGFTSFFKTKTGNEESYLFLVQKERYGRNTVMELSKKTGKISVFTAPLPAILLVDGFLLTGRAPEYELYRWKSFGIWEKTGRFAGMSYNPPNRRRDLRFLLDSETGLVFMKPQTLTDGVFEQVALIKRT